MLEKSLKCFRKFLSVKIEPAGDVIKDCETFNYIEKMM